MPCLFVLFFCIQTDKGTIQNIDWEPMVYEKPISMPDNQLNNFRFTIHFHIYDDKHVN